MGLFSELSWPGNREFGFWALKLTLANVLVFALSSAVPAMYDWFALVSGQALARPWTLLSHMFMHADVPHLYFNMFALAVFGSIFERKAGSRAFLLVYLLGGLASAAAGIIFYPSTIGASGAIFAVLGCLAIFRPRTVVWAMGVPMYVIAALFIWMAVDLLGLYSPDGVAHASHLAGMGYGALYGLWLRRESPPSKPRRKSRDEESDLPSDRELEEWERKWMMGR